MRDAIELVPAWAVRHDDLQQLLLQHKPHVVHFSGHGTADEPVASDSPDALISGRDMVVRHPGQAGQIVLMGDGGQPRLMSNAALADLFSVLKDRVYLVLLNACHSEPVAEAIGEVIACTIGMSGAISDEAAIAFAAASTGA